MCFEKDHLLSRQERLAVIARGLWRPVYLILAPFQGGPGLAGMQRHHPHAWPQLAEPFGEVLAAADSQNPGTSKGQSQANGSSNGVRDSQARIHLVHSHILGTWPSDQC